VDSLGALTEQVEKESLVKVLTRVREAVNEGTAFSKALGEHGAVFQPLYINMVAAGEASGTIEAVLDRLADFMEAQSRLKGKVLAALAYPALMLVVVMILVGVLMVAVVPKVTSIFENLGQELPWYTTLLIVTSDTIAHWWWAMLLALGGAMVAFQRWRGTAKGRLAWDTFTLKVPIFGRLNLLIAVARFSRTLSTLLGSGVQLLTAMEIGRNVLGNARLQAVIGEAIGAIREGESIAEPLKRSRAFPPMVTHMIAVGERSGQLEEMLENVSRAYEADVDTRVMALTSLLEPVMIVALGGIVGFIAMAILMPLIQMNQMVE
jgi:general secretion pathway protein F